jgi:exodeoxyribonuclease VII large subunit
VTSRTGAVIRDIVKIAHRRFPVRILLAHAQVQGDGASAEIANALDIMANIEGVDVVIVGRGGGSTEDLDAFNSEEVVRAVFRHPRPVVSAVGHETDITLVDLVADLRAATPSEAAEVVLPDRNVLLDHLYETEHKTGLAVKRRAGIEREKLAIQLSRISACDPRVRLKRNAELLARARESLARWPNLTLSRATAELAATREPIHRWPQPTLARARGEFASLTASLDALSPLASLSRGYSVVKRRTDGAIVRSADQATVGTELDITLAHGELGCVVEESKPEGKKNNADT